MRRGGRVGLIGLSSQPAEILPGAWLIKEVTLTASLAYTHEEFEMTQDLVATGRLQLAPLITDTIGIGELEEAIGRLAKPSGQIKILVDPNID